MPLLNSFYIKLSNIIKRFFPKLYCRYFEKSSFIKFLISGIVSGSLDLFLLFLFHGVFNMEIVLSTSLAFLLSFLCSFYLQRVWAFEKKENKKVPRQLVLYMLNAFLTLNINGFGMHFLTKSLDIWYIIAQLMINFSLGLFNFMVFKYIIFVEEDEINCKQKPIS